MIVIKKTFDYDLRCLTITLKNSGELDVSDLCNNVFKVLISDDDYIEFGDKKAVMVIAITDNNQEYSLHHNVYFHNESTKIDYYNQIKDYLNTTYESGGYGYHNDYIQYLKVRIWNLDNVLNKRACHPNPKI